MIEKLKNWFSEWWWKHIIQVPDRNIDRCESCRVTDEKVCDTCPYDMRKVIIDEDLRITGN